MVKTRLKRYGGKQRVAQTSRSFPRSLITAIPKSRGDVPASTSVKNHDLMELEG